MCIYDMMLTVVENEALYLLKILKCRDTDTDTQLTETDSNTKK
jgi:hypothetical protein